MNLPRVYTCSQSWTPLPSPSPYHPSGSSQCTSPSILYPASNLDWWFVSYMILYMFQCHSPKSSPPPQSPKDCSTLCSSLWIYRHLFNQSAPVAHLGRFQFLPINVRGTMSILTHWVTFKVCDSWGDLGLDTNQLECAVVTSGCFGSAVYPHCTHIFLCTHPVISPAYILRSRISKWPKG